jgi:hypothetical protein
LEKTLYIHVGPAKTGTSAIQSFLNLNETALSEKGFHYLKTFRWNGMHHPLAWMLHHKHLRDESNIHGKSFVGQFENLRPQLEDELKNVFDKSIIISSEVIAPLNEEAIDELLSLFYGMPVKVIFYVRDLYSQSLSLIAQMIKWQDTTNDDRITNAYDHLNYFYSYYTRCLDLWRNKIGKVNIIFKKFGVKYFKSGNIYADFLDAVGLHCTDDLIIPSKMENESLVYCETIYFKDLLNRIGLGTPQNMAVEQLLLWEKLNKGTKFRLPKNISNKVYKDAERIHKYLLENYLDESFTELLNKKAVMDEGSEYKLSYSDFTKLINFMDSKIGDFKKDFHGSLMSALDRTYEYQIKIRQFEDTLKSLIKEKKYVAVWGCGDVADRLFRNHSLLKDSKFCVVDKNSEKQGTIFWEHQVLSPEVITEKGIDTVIITSVVYADDIYHEIRRKYQNVKKIIKVSGLHTQIGMECIDC